MTAVTATVIGFAYDAGSGTRELTHVFAALYVLGCVAAVLTVQQSGVFTAVIQPPLILFVTVPGAYWLFHGAGFPGLKNILINCGYPLIERFPLMLLTSAAVLLIGMVRWYLGFGTRSAGAEAAEPTTGLAAKLAAVWSRRSTGDDDSAPARPARRPRAERPTHTTRTARATGATRGSSANGRSAASRTRHTRPLRDDPGRTSADRPRRPRLDDERGGSPDPRRRPREPRDGRREPLQRRDGSARRSRLDDYDSYESPEPPRRRAAAANGAGATHHPISQVRYRGASDREQPRTRRPREQS